MKQNRKKVKNYLTLVYDRLQELCDEHGPNDEELADVLAVLQSDVDSAISELEMSD